MFKTEIISHTEPSISLISKGIDNLEEYIAYVARVSNPDNQLNTETSGRLLQYLIRNKHWSPFEMASVTIGITTTRDIGRQILRHRSFSFQEFSQRYQVVSNIFDTRQARLQDTKNRQNSIVVDDQLLQEWFEEAQDEVSSLAMKKYQESLDRGIAKEQARIFLPEGLTLTTIYMAGTVRSWIHYCAERRKLGVQLEHRLIAQSCQEHLSKLIPSISDIIQIEVDSQINS